jgi:hypothetical protein
MRRKRVSINLESGAYDALERIASAEDRTPAEVLRVLVGDLLPILAARGSGVADFRRDLVRHFGARRPSRSAPLHLVTP